MKQKKWHSARPGGMPLFLLSAPILPAFLFLVPAARAQLVLMLIFFFRRHPASDMAFRFVDVQYHTRPGCKRRIDMGKALGHIFMHGRFTDPKFPGRLLTPPSNGELFARIIHADAGICMTGGHGHQDGVEEADSPWGVRAAIRRQLRAGADWVKILTSNRGDIPEFTQEELDAAVDEAHRQGVKIAVHSGTQPSIQMCIDAGFDTIEHGTFLTEAQARQMAKKGIAWTPTITAYTYLYEQTKQMIEAGVDMDNPIAARAVHDQAFFKPAFEAYRDNFKKLYDTGVTVLAGSDMVLYKAPPLPIHQELGYMVDYGITPMEAIRTATYNAASVLGIENETGSLKEGLAGDLLIVKGDVSKNIRALDDVQEVYLAGEIVYTV